MSRFTLQNVRASFAHVFSPNDRFDNGKYEITCLINKKSQPEVIALCKAKIKEALLAEFGSEAKIPPGIWGEQYCCLRDGDLSSYSGYAGHASFKASQTEPPKALTRDKKEVKESDGLIYSGAYVDVVVQVWIQNNQYGKKVNANLYAVRHRAHGDKLSGGGIPESIEDDFEDLEEQELAEITDDDLDF